MKFLLFGLLLFLSACMTHYENVPIEDPANETGTIETIDLDTADVTIDEDLTVARAGRSGIPNPDLDAGTIDRSAGGSGSRGTMVKPLEVASVESRPANSLLSQANAAISAGNHAKAEVLLERALRITPRNPKLWYRISQVKYAKGDYRQASAMAMRSNTMTSSRRMKKQNWRIIANAREKLGDMAGAEQARRYASQ